MKATCMQNGVKLTAHKPNHANRKQTKEKTFVAVLPAFVQYMKLNMNNVG